MLDRRDANSVPAGLSRISLSKAKLASKLLKAGVSVSSKRSPAVVGATLRVVRVNSRTPRRPSSRRTTCLSADWDMPILAAAAVKLPASVTARNAARSARSSRVIQ